jgi:hypothetical protein
MGFPLVFTIFLSYSPYNCIGVYWSTVSHKEWLHGLTILVVIRTSDFQTVINPNSLFGYLHLCKTDGLMMTAVVGPYRHSSWDIVTRKIQENFEDGNNIALKRYQYINVSMCLVICLFIFLFLSSGQTISLRKWDFFWNPLYLPLAEVSPCGDLEWWWGEVLGLPPLISFHQCLRLILSLPSLHKLSNWLDYCNKRLKSSPITSGFSCHYFISASYTYVYLPQTLYSIRNWQRFQIQQFCLCIS